MPMVWNLTGYLGRMLELYLPVCILVGFFCGLFLVTKDQKAYFYLLEVLQYLRVLV